MSIEPGTLCYIVRVDPGNERFIGRIVTVVSGLQPIPDRGVMHEVDAPWLRAEFPGHYRHFAPPSHLRPIAGPDQLPPIPVDREPEPEHA